MVYQCAAFNCSNRQTKGCGIGFHGFPRDKELLKKWVIAIKRANFVPSNHSKICSKHFEEEAFQIRPNASYKLLKPDSIPTIFDFPAHLQPPPKKKRRVLERIQKNTSNPALQVTREDPSQIIESTQECADKMRSNNERTHYPHTAKRKIPAAKQKENLPPDVGMPGEEHATRALSVEGPSVGPITSKSKWTPSSPIKKYLRRKVKILQQRVRRRDKRIQSMKDLITTLEKKLNAPYRLVEILKDNFSGFPLHLLLHNAKNGTKKGKTRETYTEEMKEFALTLYFYSPKTYKYLKGVNLCLPNPSTLRKWISRFNCQPGLLEEVFQYLRENVGVKEYLKNVNLVFDAMDIRKQLIYSEKEGKHVGYSDLGGIKVANHEELATEALVYQIVSLKGNFKCVVAYFFIDKLDAEALAQLTRTIILKLNSVGVKVQNVTFDGTSSNVSSLKKLGCQFPEKPFFRLPDLDYDICALLDPCHMLKLCRNSLADMKIIETPNGLAKFTYIERLNDLQNKEGLRFANKLSDRHVYYRYKKMNVKLAAQTLSSGVADAIDYLRTKGHPDFTGSEATVEFIRIIDRLFDYMNSRDPQETHFKSPIRLSNKEADDAMLSGAYYYLSNLKIDGKPILTHPRKTFALGFLCNIKTIQRLRDRLLALDEFQYFLTYKLSQDHLELFFSCIRSRGGHNNNPNVEQFRWALRKLMFRNSVRASDGANCCQFDANHQNAVVNFDANPQLVDFTDEDELDCAALSLMIEEGSYKDSIIYYICGFVVRRLGEKVKCDECLKLLIAGESDLSPFTHFTDFVSRGKLIRASYDAYKLAKYIFCMVTSCGNTKERNANVIMSKVNNHFQCNLFDGHVSTPLENHKHVVSLINVFGRFFLKIVMYNLANQVTEQKNAKKLGLRQRLTKLILFNNQ